MAFVLMILEFFVEEPSTLTALNILIPKILPNTYFEIHSFQGKNDLLKNLPNRLGVYAKYLAYDYKIIVLVDRDSDDCHELKEKLESFALRAGLKTLTNSPNHFQIINRIVIEELEAWFFGDVEAICKAYPGVPANLHQKAQYRDSDAIKGGTWEHLENVLKRNGYYRDGLVKPRAARDISRHMEPDRNRSRSFQVFRDALKSIQKQGECA